MKSVRGGGASLAARAGPAQQQHLPSAAAAGPAQQQSSIPAMPRRRLPALLTIFNKQEYFFFFNILISLCAKGLIEKLIPRSLKNSHIVVAASGPLAEALALVLLYSELPVF